MASGDNQGLQIAVIVFVMLTLVSSVMAFVFFTQYNQAAAEAKQAKQDLAQKEADLRKKTDELIGTNAKFGLADTATSAEIDTLYNDDVSKFMLNVPDDKKNYHASLEYLFTTVQQLQTDKGTLQGEIDTLRKQNEDFQATAQKQIDEFRAAADKAAADLTAAQAKFADDVKQKDDEIAKLTAEGAAAKQAKDDEIAKLNEKVAGLEGEVRGVVATSAEKDKKIREISGSEGPVSYDGEIQWVNAGSRVVWINRGRADNLTRQTTFFVQPADVAPGAKLPPKGRIEVTQILDAHLAEARILDDSLLDPLLPGDKIYTPLWDPGQVIHYGLAGTMDLNGDGTDDSEKLRSLISIHGGVIDAELDAEGNVVGSMSVNTRYLILGAEPRQAAGYTELRDAATKLGVQVIPLNAFLAQVGWQNTDSTAVVRYGRGGNIDTVPPVAPDGAGRVSPGSVSPLFEKRRPPPRPAGTTY